MRRYTEVDKGLVDRVSEGVLVAMEVGPVGVDEERKTNRDVVDQPQHGRLDLFGTQNLELLLRQREANNLAREEHDRTHAPHLIWCPHCVRGRAKADRHRRNS